MYLFYVYEYSVAVLTNSCEPSCGNEACSLKSLPVGPAWPLGPHYPLPQPPPSCPTALSCSTTLRSSSLQLYSLQPKEFIYYYIWVHCSCLQTHQKRASDLITDGCEPPCGCWDLNSKPLEKQSVLLTAEPSSLQPLQFTQCIFCAFWHI